MGSYLGGRQGWNRKSLQPAALKNLKIKEKKNSLLLKINPPAASHNPGEGFLFSLPHTPLRGSFTISFAFKAFLNSVNSGNKIVAVFVVKHLAMRPLGSFHFF